MPRRPFCPICFGSGVMRQNKKARWEKCYCGRLADSKGEAKLAKQYRLDKRLEELKQGKSW